MSAAPPFVERDGKVITLTFGSLSDAEHVEVALTNRQWMQVVGRNVRLAREDEEPKMSDYDLLIAGHNAPIFRAKTPGTDPVQTLVTGNLAAACTDDKMWSCYVQHIGADSPHGYEKCFKWMAEAGFTLLRSPRGADGKHWEVWYCPGSWALNDGLKGCTRRELVKWLYDWVRPGTVAFDGERWCLGVGD